MKPGMKFKQRHFIDSKLLLVYPQFLIALILYTFYSCCAKAFCLLNCFQVLFYSAFFGGFPLKRFAPNKVNMRALIPQVKQGFKIVLKRPALRNLILVIFACVRAPTFRIKHACGALTCVSSPL